MPSFFYSLVVSMLLGAFSIMATGPHPDFDGLSNVVQVVNKIRDKQFIEEKKIRQEQQQRSRRLILSPQEFTTQFCPDFQKQLAQSKTGISCTCKGRADYRLTCARNQVCASVLEGGGSCEDSSVCSVLTFTIDFNKALTVTNITLIDDFVRGPVGYNRTRLVDDGDNCKFFYSLHGLEYQCNSCQVCGSNPLILSSNPYKTRYMMDCTNIQPNAETGTGCSESGLLFPFIKSGTGVESTLPFQWCFPNNATPPLPIDTPGMTPFEIPLDTLPSGAASMPGLYFVGLLGLIGSVLVLF